MSDSVKCGACCCVAVLIGSIILISISAATIEPIEYGIKYSVLGKSVDTDYGVKDGGWYLLGPLNKFLLFPSIVTNLDFSSDINQETTDNNGNVRKANTPIVARTKDGYPLTLSFSF